MVIACDGLPSGYVVKLIQVSASEHGRCGSADLLNLSQYYSFTPAVRRYLSEALLGEVGADADISIYHENPDGALMFRYPRYVIKAGQVVVEEGQIRSMAEGREFLVQPSYEPAIEDYLRPLFQQHYTMSFENYPVELERIERADVRPCN